MVDPTIYENPGDDSEDEILDVIDITEELPDELQQNTEEPRREGIHFMFDLETGRVSVVME